MSNEAHLRRARLAGRYAASLAVAALCLLSGASPAWAAASGAGRHKSSGLSMIVMFGVVLLLAGVAGAARAGYKRRRAAEG
jgi:hypothetical protein